jgi:hypothetical protein
MALRFVEDRGDWSAVRLRRVDVGFFLAAMATAAAGAAYFAGRGQTSGVVSCGLIAAILAAALVLLSGEAFCPHCESGLTGLPLLGALKAYARCGACRRYLRREGGRLSALDDAHVAKAAEFAIPVDAVKELPMLCCVCLRPASRLQDLVYAAAVRRSPGYPAGKPMEFKAAAPYCDEHFGSATLAWEDLAAFPGISARMLAEPEAADPHFVLKVRSYGFYRAALDAG